MKNVVLFIIACLLILSSCKNENSTNSNYIPPFAGSIIASDSMSITEEDLNDFNFKVQVKANENSSDGNYTIIADYGVDNATGFFNMPKNGEHLKPLLRKGLQPYSYIIGFQFGKDTTFHDYFEVSAFKANPGRRAIKMVYLKSYTFE